MFDIYGGDPKLKLNEDGSTIEVIGGQPIMDQGVENQALISLFTLPDWFGNELFEDQAEKIGSEFSEISRGTITLSRLEDIRQEAINSLEYDGFGDIEAEVLNPESNRINVKITITPPGEDRQTLILNRSGQNWIQQYKYPANNRISE